MNRFVAGFIGSPAMNFLDVTVAGSGDATTLEAPDATIPVPGPPPRRRRSGRPDAHRRLPPRSLRPGRAAAAAAATIRGRADVVEYLGAQELLHVSAAGKDLVAIVDAENRVQPGQELTLRLPLDKLHVFDIETGLSLDVLAKQVPA